MLGQDNIGERLGMWHSGVVAPADPGLDMLAQNKEMRRYPAGPRYENRSRGEAGITAQYLEAMDDDELGGDSDDADGLTATERARNALRRNVHVCLRSLLEPSFATQGSQHSPSVTPRHWNGPNCSAWQALYQACMLKKRS